MHTPYVCSGYITSLRSGGALDYEILELRHLLRNDRRSVATHHHSTGIGLLGHGDEVVTEADFVTLIFGVGSGFTVIHFSGACRLEYTGSVEGE